MGKTLIIAEKPSVAGDIAKALGGFKKEGSCLEREDVVISSGIGHLLEIQCPKSEEVGFNLPRLPLFPSAFELTPVENTVAQLQLLGKLMKRGDIDTIVNACDAGREGELIFRYIYQYHNCRKPTKRMWLQSMTPAAIRDAWARMKSGTEFDNLADAATCRSESDWLVGVNGTRGMSAIREIQTGKRELTSIGRVQTPVLALVVDREDQIRTFVPKDYWEIHGTFGAKSGAYQAKWQNPDFKAEAENSEDAKIDRTLDQGKASAVLQRCQGQAPSSVKDETKPTSKAAPGLFDLTLLQREANKQLGFSAKTTLNLAQSLYEKHKVLSYPRTESRHLPDDYIETAKSVLGSFTTDHEYGEHAERVLSNGWIKPNKKIFDGSKISDHFAIIPTGQVPHDLTSDERKIFDLVMRRFLAVFHPAAEYLQTIRTTIVANETFEARGRILVSEGWLAVYGRQADEDDTPSLPPIADGEIPKNQEIKLVSQKTKAPSRYTEETLLAAMESPGKLVEDDELRDAISVRGLGTPATRAQTIEALLSKNREYMVRDKKFLAPTDKGTQTIKQLRAEGLDVLTQAKLTAEWEFKLLQMEKGKYDRNAFMQEIKDFTTQVIQKIQERAKTTPRAEKAVLKAPCPKCGGQVSERHMTFECDCGFKIWKVIAGRTMKSTEVAQLLNERTSPVLSGFKSKAKKPFSAALVLNDEGNIEFKFEDRPKGAAEPIGEDCPHCQKPIVDSGKAYACSGCNFKIWKEVASRPLSREEVGLLIRNKSTGVLKGFTSKAKKPFSARLTLSDDGKVEMAFD